MKKIGEKNATNLNKGITLISLIITIIVMLILVGATISVALNGGLFNIAKQATEKAEIEREKETINLAIINLKTANKEVTKENLQEELNKLIGNTDTQVEKMGENDLLVTFPSGRMYEVEEWNITYIGKKGELEDAIRITVDKESDTTAKQIQEVQITIKTYDRDENKDIKLKYAWNNSKTKKPSEQQYKDAEIEKNPLIERAKVDSGEQETGNYYLWIKVTVDNKEIEKTYGEYYIRKYTTLVSTRNEYNSTSGFLGNNDIQRGKIRTVTLTNSIEGKKAGEDNCWDVSTTKEGFILAWYTEENIGEDTYYNVTIGQEGKIIANADSHYLFAYIGKDITSGEVKIEGLENLDTSNVTSMSHMFYYCRNLTTLDVSSFDTSNVKNMGSMFSYCRNLTTLDVSNFDTRNVTSMSYMFQNCNNLMNLDVSNFDTSNVTNMRGMFMSCHNLVKLDVSNFDTSNVTSMIFMFFYCSKLTDLDLSRFNTSNVTNMSNMFSGCKFDSIDLRNFNTTNVTDMSSMFSFCSLKDLDMSNFDTSNVTDMSNMFNSSRITNLDLRNWVIKDEVNVYNMFISASVDSITVSTQEMKDKLLSIRDFKNINIVE